MGQDHLRLNKRDFLLSKGDILEKPFQVYLKPMINRQCGKGDNKKSLGIETT